MFQATDLGPRALAARPAPATILATSLLLLLGASPCLPQSQRVEMTLEQAVARAVSASRVVRAALLTREQSRNSLRVADHEFRPFVDVEASGLARRPEAGSRTRPVDADATSTLRLALRTGGSVTYGLEASATDLLADGGALHRYAHVLTLTQPLLKGRGSVATVGQDLARLGDRGAGLGLEAAVSDIVDATVFAYRDLLSAREELGIAHRSLDDARELAANTEALIEAGRLPAVERIQSDTVIANRELQVLINRNGVAQAGLALVSTLDLDLDTEIVPVDSVRGERREVDPEEALRTLLARNPEYRALRLQVQEARLGLKAAEDGDRLDVLATGSLRGDGASTPGDRTAWTRDWNAGLSFRRTLGDPARNVAVVSARLLLETAELTLAKAEDSVRIELRQELRNLDVAWRRLELATRARELSATQLEIEREKLNAGRSASFQMVRFQNDLDDARHGELAASISYANEVTRLDRALGRTLEVWGIDLDALLAQRVTAAPAASPAAAQP